MHRPLYTQLGALVVRIYEIFWVIKIKLMPRCRRTTLGIEKRASGERQNEQIIGQINFRVDVYIEH